MNTKFAQLRSRGVALKTAIGSAAMASAAAANAALPEWASSEISKIGTAISDTIAAVGPYVMAALVGGITITLIKRFGKKI